MKKPMEPETTEVFKIVDLIVEEHQSGEMLWGTLPTFECEVSGAKHPER